MNILICDDIKAETEKLAKILRDCGCVTNVTVFHSGADALAYTRSGAAVDCCFLDIVMPEMSGIVLAEQLRADGFTGEIVFLSTSHEYGPESYTVKAFSYLIKPLMPQNIEELLREIKQAQDRKSSNTDGIMVNTKSSVRFILFREIAYVEVKKHTVYFRLKGGDDVHVYAALTEIAPKLLTDTRFAQCHKSFLINMDAVSAINSKELVMMNKISIPISRSYAGIKNKYVQWRTRREQQ